MGTSSSSATIVNENTTVIINAVNAAANTNPGTFSTIPPDSDAQAVEQSLQKSLSSTLAAAWNARFSSANPLQSGNIDYAFLIVTGSLSTSTPVTCAVSQITDDLNAWQVTGGADVATSIAKQILNALVMESGLVAMTSGIHTLGPAQKVGWAAATLTAVAGNGPNATNLIGYAFSASDVTAS